MKRPSLPHIGEEESGKRIKTGTAAAAKEEYSRIYKENYGNFITCLTKENGINYRMKRSKG